MGSLRDSRETAQIKWYLYLGSERRDELALPGGHARPQPLRELAHDRPPPGRRAGRERRADQRPEPAVPVPGLVEDVGVDLLPQPAPGDAEQVRDLPAGERGLLGPQEELTRL